MWDTTKDYRLKIAEKATNGFLRVIESGNFKGHWNKKMVREISRNMDSDFQTLSYSYLDPKDLAETPQIDELEKKINDVIRYLGGESWYNDFLKLSSRDEREKVIESLTKARFFINTILGLRGRLKLGEIQDPIIGIDIKTGEIMSVSSHSKTDDLMVCNVNLGKRAITVVTNDLTVKEGNHVGIAMLPPESFRGITSEGMFLGAGEGILKDVKGEFGEMPHGIPLESLNEARNLLEAYLKE